MEKIKGQNLRIKLDGKYVAMATSCTLHVSVNLEESSTKDSTNGWQENEITGMSWDISVDSLYAVGDDDTTGIGGEASLDLILAQKEVTVEFERTSGAQNRVAVTGGKVYTGKAFVNDISIQAQNRQNTTYTLQATGNGELAPKASGE